MKKLTAFFFALVLLLSLCACTTTPSTTEAPAPTEPPYKTVYVHSSITQEFGSTVSRTEYVFDDQNTVSEVVVYTNDSETKRHTVENDENGNYIRWTSDGSVIEYRYDEHGHNLGSSMYIDGNLVSATEYIWENGLRTSITTKMASQQTMTQKVLMTYNAAGQVLRQDTYTADTLSSYSIYAYNQDGKTESITTYQPDGTVLSSSSNTWNGNTQTITTVDATGNVSQTAVRTYDENGNLLTHIVYNANGDLISKETHTWKAIEVDHDCPRASM